MGRTISAAAHAAGVHVETIRYYERRGLIEQPPRPKNGGYREYSAEIIRRVRFIRKAQKLGFSLREVEGLLTLKSDPATGCGDVRASAIEQLERIDELISDLKRKRSALAAIIEACPGEGAVSRCSILNALSA